MKKNQWEKWKKILIWISIGIETLLGIEFLILYTLAEEGNSFRNTYYFLSIAMFFVALITIITNDLGGKVVSVVKKVASVIYAVTIGVVAKVFDSLFNMATGNKEIKLRKIKGYEDTVSAIQRKKKKRKANYKRYKDMDNREKVRFLYYKAVTKAIRKGFFFSDADTPLEVNGRLIEAKYLKTNKTELGNIYNLSRYDNESDITDEMVNVIKETY